MSVLFGKTRTAPRDVTNFSELLRLNIIFLYDPSSCVLYVYFYIRYIRPFNSGPLYNTRCFLSLTSLSLSLSHTRYKIKLLNKFCDLAISPLLSVSSSLPLYFESCTYYLSDNTSCVDTISNMYYLIYKKRLELYAQLDIRLVSNGLIALLKIILK